MTRSAYADRDTVGTIALKARNSGERVVAGDMGHELMPQLVQDLNEAIASNPFDDRPFYITIHEKKDLLLTNMILRRVIKQEDRPYPEDATDVFWTNPKTDETLHCWTIPHKSLFDNILENAHRHSKEQLKDIMAWKLEKMEHFGFQKIGMHDDKTPIYLPMKNFKDRKLRNK